MSRTRLEFWQDAYIAAVASGNVAGSDDVAASCLEGCDQIFRYADEIRKGDLFDHGGSTWEVVTATGGLLLAKDTKAGTVVQREFGARDVSVWLVAK